jgi:hypothetical protein
LLNCNSVIVDCGFTEPIVCEDGKRHGFTVCLVFSWMVLLLPA